jgi:hypothetical protein
MKKRRNEGRGEAEKVGNEAEAEKAARDGWSGDAITSKEEKD